MNKFLDHLLKDQKRVVVFLFVLSSFYFIGLGNVHLFDWDEINFAESAREMIESGDYLRVQINYQPFWEKPPLFFWLQVASMKFFGINEFAARFPNALFGFIYLLSFYFIGKKHFSPKFGLIWALVFFGSILPHIYFKSGIIDPIFNYFIFMSIYFMLLVFDEKNKNKNYLALISGLFSGLSIVTKGPVGFLLLGLTFLVYIIWKRFKIFPKGKYILLFVVGLLLVLSGWLSMEVYQNGLKVLIQFIEYQVELFNSPVAGHAQPFYYHFVVVFLGCFPMSIFAIPTLIKSQEVLPYDFQKWMKSLFWVVMILFSITSTKIVHYSSMAYAPLSFLAAFYLHSIIHNKQAIKKYISYLFLGIGVIVGSMITILPILLKYKEKLFPFMKDPFAVESLATYVKWSGFEFLVGLLLISGTVISFIFMKKNQIQKALSVSIFSVATTLFLVLLFILPKIEAFTQRPAISFYKSLKNNDCYIEVYGFKSYAQYFYSQIPYGLNENRLNQDWLLNGEIDKPVYFISKVTNRELDDHPNFNLIKKEGGFLFYKRLP